MALSRVEINRRSDEKRGVRTKGIKLHSDTIELLERLSKDLDMPQSQIVTEALESYAKAQKLSQKSHRWGGSGRKNTNYYSFAF